MLLQNCGDRVLYPLPTGGGAGEPGGKGNGWYYYDNDAGTYLPW